MGLTTDVAMTFAARLLIRFATLVPDVIDLRRTGRDIEALAQVLQRGPGPGAMLAEQIEQVLRRARSKRVLPPPSRGSSPHPGAGLNRTALSDARSGDEAGRGHGKGNGLEGLGGGAGENGGAEVGADLANVGFEFLNDWSFPEDLFNGNSLNDDDVSQECHSLQRWCRQALTTGHEHLRVVPSVRYRHAWACAV